MFPRWVDQAVGLAAAGVTLWAGLRLWRSLRAFSPRGKTVLITGGSRGLGLVLARELAAEGARIAICSRDPAELDRAEQNLAAQGADVLAFPCDLTNAPQVQGMIAQVLQRRRRIDLLINNAGSICVGPLETMTLDDFRQEMDNNYWSAVHATLALLPSMREQQAGRIVNIASIGGEISVPHLLPYSASKFALVGFSEGLRAEVAKDGIVVTTVCPGLMRTGSARNAEFKGRHRAEYAWFSISDALPILSMSAERAARQIIAACKRGDAKVVLSWPAKLAARLHGLFPGLTCDLLSLVNRVLPGPGGVGTRRVKGKDSESAVSPSILTTLSDRAAERNNEIQRGDGLVSPGIRLGRRSSNTVSNSGRP
jgi:short-subunit dehydrogenase